MTKRSYELDDMLYELSITDTDKRLYHLRELCESYPQHAMDLALFYVELAFSEYKSTSGDDNRA